MGGLKSFWLMSVPSRRQDAGGVLALASELCEALKPLLVPNVRLSQAIQPKTVVERSRTFKAGKPDDYIMLKLGSVRLELFSTDPAQTVNANGGEQVIGFKHLAFDVPKLEPAIAALRADGIEPDPIIDLGDVIPGFRIVFFRDREGNILELMEGYRDEERDQR